MPINKRLARVGIAKQSAKGSPAAVPAYGFGVTDGQVLTVDIEQENEEITSDKRAVPGQNRNKAVPGAEWTTRAYRKSIGLLFYLALGSKSVSGAGPYTHVITPADTLPYCTVFGRQGADYPVVSDCQVDELTLSWEEAGPLEVSATFMGLILVLGGGAWTATTDEKDADGKFRGAGGTFKLDAVTGVPVTAKVKAGELSIPNGLEAVHLSDKITPDDLMSSVSELMQSLTIVPANLDEFRKIVTGSAGGTAITDVPVYGSFENTFIMGAHSLKVEASRVAFMTDFPDADPAGGPVELELEGLIAEPLTGQQLTVTLINDVATY